MLQNDRLELARTECERRYDAKPGLGFAVECMNIE